MNRTALRLIGLLGFGAMLAQAGHLLVYQVQFGSAALAIQSQGPHAYFPTLAKTSVGVAGVGLMGALLVIGASRLLTARPNDPVASPSYLPLLSTLFTVQLSCFVAQETIESLLAGSAPASAMHLVLFGTLGQLPIAAVAALALKWIAARIETAWVSLLQEFATTTATFGWTRLILGRRDLEPQWVLAEIYPLAYVKRGPPEVIPA